jgi:hypothetical protein
MKLIFKIVEYLPETEQIVVKFSRQNAPKPIDDYPAVAIDCINLDCTDHYSLTSSIFKYGSLNILAQEKEEPTLDENKADDIVDSTLFEDYINRVVEIDSDELSVESRRLNRIQL